jgi:hypothetical protein
MRISGLGALAVSAIAMGCTSSVGECDQPRALELAYDQDGVPAFAGQAIMIRDCGGGGFCHASGIAAEDRFGAPHGLDFDLRPASTGSAFSTTEAENAAVARLEADRLRTLQLRDEVWAQVEAGLMPPSGDAGEEYRSSVTASFEVVTDESGTELAPLPGLDTEDGRDILRNWLACGAPVVERTQERADREPTENFVVPVCQRDCVDMTWPAIHEQVMQPSCATGRCHDDSEPAAQLDLSGGALAAHARLLDAPARGALCAAETTPMLSAGDADASLLWLKVGLESAEQVCGSRMPLSGSALSDQRLCAIREWIACGACPEGRGAEGNTCAECIAETERLERCNLAVEGDEVVCAEQAPCLPRASL